MTDGAAPAEQRLIVRRAIAADPATIFGILRTPSGHVAIDASGMLMSAEGEPVNGFKYHRGAVVDGNRKP